MCISGDVADLNEEQWEVIGRGMAFYRKIAPIIKHGQTYHLSPQIARIRHPEGWQGIVRVGRNGDAYALIHTFGGAYPQEIELALPEGAPQHVADIYSDTPETVLVKDGKLHYRPQGNWKAVAVYLQKK